MSDTHKAEIVHAPPREARALASAERMHPLVAAAVATGSDFDPATLRELLAVQREWEAGEAKKAFTRALAALKRDLPTVIGHDRLVDYPNKNSNGRTRYTHTSLAAVMEAVTEHLTAHGFSLNWTPAIGERSVRVTCRLTHTEGHHEECTLEAPADTSGGKNPAQAVMSTVTLLSRYTALSLLGIATADMQEPTGEGADEPDLDRIDAAKNMQAVRALAKAGIAREDAEGYLTKPVSQWTGADLRELRAWFDERRAAREGADGAA